MCIYSRVPNIYRVEVVWWLMRTDQYDEFRVWTLDVCNPNLNPDPNPNPIPTPTPTPNPNPNPSPYPNP